MSQGESGFGGGVRPVGSGYRYDDGLHVRVDDVVPYELVDPEGSEGYRQGDDLIRCTLHLDNDTARPVDVDGIALLVRGGPYGKTGRRVVDRESSVLDGELQGTLREGRRTSATWAYCVPAGTAADLDIEVRFPGRHGRRGVTFTTAGAPASTAPGGLPRAGRLRVGSLPDQAPLFGERQPSLFTDPEPEPVDGGGRPGPGTLPAPARPASPRPAGPDPRRGAPDAAGAPAGPARPQETAPGDPDALRVRQIFRFLAEAEESRTRPVRTLDGAAGVVWFEELPHAPEVSVMLDGALATEEPAWVTVARPERQDAPHLPPLLAPWVDETRIRDFKQNRAPHLRRRIEPEFPDWSRGSPWRRRTTNSTGTPSGRGSRSGTRPGSRSGWRGPSGAAPSTPSSGSTTACTRCTRTPPTSVRPTNSCWDSGASPGRPPAASASSATWSPAGPSSSSTRPPAPSPPPPTRRPWGRNWRRACSKGPSTYPAPCASRSSTCWTAPPT
ncbi:hypothetical protein LUX01_01775 [Streptomyces sudanensis]|uniref:hypothetical protein n=1 Tax=Streptomyces sudanensis TaxID=436397 RepID=UPI0020CFC04A|nr:hypothetical protein [Streptomyces sudanensis]MCP9985616.1 hypothetical protein [Streptomyces sudanensis]